MRLFILFVFICINLYAFAQKNLLSGNISADQLKSIISPLEKYHPYPTASDRKEWDSVPEQMQKAYIKLAEKIHDTPWEITKASISLDYIRNGNRNRYERITFGRRTRLASLVIAECIENKGRFMDDILDGVWMICEETYWGIPAHLWLQKKGLGLPDVTEPTVDLFASETGMLLAWTDYLLGEKLDKLHVMIRERIKHEVDRRIISPNLNRDDFWWMGFGTHPLNNWTPWICSNWLTCVLFIEKDPDIRAKSIFKIMQCLDNFLNPYPADGGCDEGPSYWTRAGASLYENLELLYSASDGKIDFFNNNLVKEMGRYIYKAYIHDPYYINFADGPARLEPEAGLVYRYGKSIKDETMLKFGAYLAKSQKLGDSLIECSYGCLLRLIPSIFIIPEIKNTNPSEPLISDFWLPDIQVMGARSNPGSTSGLYLAAQGGHNAESHNHNDVGNFVIYADGYPLIVDPGVESYIAKTFSSERYDIWTMQSAYHNLPTINGIMQKDGKEYKAKDVKFSADKKKVQFNLDISEAYPKNAGIKYWNRVITLNRGKNVTIQDSYELTDAKEKTQFSFMCWRKPLQENNSKIRFENTDDLKNLKSAYLSYDTDKFDIKIETIELTDGRIKSSWGKYLYRILLTEKEKTLKDKCVFRVWQE